METGTFSFSTGGPAVRELTPREGQINEDQAFILELDTEADEQAR